MNDSPENLEGEEFIFKYGRLRLLPLDQLRKDEFGDTIASEQKAYRRERVVRCRDCKHAYKEGTLCTHFALQDDYNMSLTPSFVEPDGFCAWGERRGE